MIFDHIGIFVKDLEKGRELLTSLLPINEFTGPIEDPGLHVIVQFCTDASGVRYELVAPFGENNPVAGVLKSGRNILNHVAYRVRHLEMECVRLREMGCVPLGKPAPAVAFGGKRVVFYLTPLTFIIELIENDE